MRSACKDRTRLMLPHIAVSLHKKRRKNVKMTRLTNLNARRSRTVLIVGSHVTTVRVCDSRNHYKRIRDACLNQRGTNRIAQSTKEERTALVKPARALTEPT